MKKLPLEKSTSNELTLSKSPDKNIFQRKLNEECGVFGIYNKDEHKRSSFAIYSGLYMLQHRGQESAGIAITSGREISCYKQMGLVRDVFDEMTLNCLTGRLGIGHVRYSTAGSSTVDNAQPLVYKVPGINFAFCFNGTISNARSLKLKLQKKGVTFKSNADTEVLCQLIIGELKKLSKTSRYDEKASLYKFSRFELSKALRKALLQVHGAYAILLIINNILVAIRDPHGIRPLCYGETENESAFSSESCAFDPLGIKFVRDVEPGEIMMVKYNGWKSFNLYEKKSNQKSIQKSSNFCIFELVYFGRPDTNFSGLNVYQSRYQAGVNLFKELKNSPKYKNIKSAPKIDLAIPVPDSGIPSALGFAKAAKIEFGEGLIKNKYVGRTFIEPTQELRENAVKMKLNVLEKVVKNKSIALFDDSIVRGTTIKKIIELLKNAGAKEIHVFVASPPVKYPCYYGIDTPNRRNLISNKLNTAQLTDFIGADSLHFLSLKGLKDAQKGADTGFCLACFSGNYPDDVSEIKAFQKSTSKKNNLKELNNDLKIIKSLTNNKKNSSNSKKNSPKTSHKK